MQSAKCQIRFPNHCCYIRVDPDHIHIFKYNKRACDFAIYSIDEQDLASDYIMTELPCVYYAVTVQGDC
jgi:hypothetical protein